MKIILANRACSVKPTLQYRIHNTSTIVYASPDELGGTIDLFFFLTHYYCFMGKLFAND